MLDLLRFTKIDMHSVCFNPVHIRNIVHYLEYTEQPDSPLMAFECMKLLSSSCSCFLFLGVGNKTAYLIRSMFKHLHPRLRQWIYILVNILMEIEKPLLSSFRFELVYIPTSFVIFHVKLTGHNH